MRKHKSVVAILLAVMMIFTFMPVMSFADDITTSWNGDYTAVTITNSTTGTSKTYTNISKRWDSDNGKVTAFIDWSDYTSSDGAVASIDYYDFNYGAINVVGNWDFDTFVGAIKSEEDKTLHSANAPIVLTKPAYVKDSAVTGNGDKDTKVPFVDKTGTSHGTANLDSEVYYAGFDKNSYEPQTVTLTATVVPYGTGQSSVTHAAFIGTIPQKTINVSAQTGKLDQVKVDVDKITNASSRTIGTQNYDGKAHKLVNNDVPGFTVAYKLQNATTKVYEDVDAVTFEKAGTVNAAVVITNTKTKAVVTEYKTFIVNPAGRVNFGFDKAEYSIPGTEFDPWDFVEVSAYSTSDTAKDAVSANKDALKAAVKDAYDLIETPDKYNPNVIALKLTLKKDYVAADFYKAHKELFDNFNEANTLREELTTASIATNVGTLDDDISFEGQTKYVYSGKKTSKKGVLKKAQTIAVSATADSGKDITFVATKTAGGKIVVSADGKITVKKGLKKGKYNVTVKAKTKAGYGYKAAKESQVYTIQIKK